MKHKEKLTEALKNVSEKLRSELDYYMNDVEHEDEYGICDAFDDAVEILGVNKEIKQIYIAIGYAVTVDITKVFSTGKRYWFMLDGKHYDCVSGWSEWIES